VRHAPELTFHIDTSADVKDRISVLLGRAERRKKASQAAGRVSG
jgi:ribosome-binding factor A